MMLHITAPIVDRGSLSLSLSRHRRQSGDSLLDKVTEPTHQCLGPQLRKVTRDI